jgi:hypothetical protein
MIEHARRDERSLSPLAFRSLQIVKASTLLNHSRDGSY